jgi:RNA polymerase sigma-70 factor (ECF subfamily)
MRIVTEVAILAIDVEQVSIMEHETIKSLLRRIRTGDEDALLDLHEQFATLVYSVTYRVLGNQQDSEEATQDVFLRLWDKAEQFDAARGSFTAWLLTIARHVAIDRLRKRQRREPPPNSVSMDEKPHLWETTLIKEDLSDLQRTLLSTLKELPEEQQQTIYLAYFHGMSHRDIAEHLDKPLGTVKSQIRLGMQKLRDIWLKQQYQTVDDELSKH